MTQKFHWVDSNGYIELQFTKNEFMSCSGSGTQDDNVAELQSTSAVQKQLLSIPNTTLQRVLQEYGAWDESELMNRTENELRLVWIACCDLREEHGQ